MSKLSTDYTGRRFTHLVSEGRSDRTDRDGYRAFETVRCCCGKVKSVSIYSLLDGNVRSCGCKRIEMLSTSKTIHGHCMNGASPTYRAYSAAISRCTHPKNKRWARYGGRGIEMCDRWMESFSNFLEDMGERPGLGYQLDREENDGNYEPGNCRWVKRRLNMNNTSQCRFIKAFGLEMTVAQWSRQSGINTETIRGRLSRGWTAEDAVSRDATMISDLSEIRKIIEATDQLDLLSLQKCLRQISSLLDERLIDEIPSFPRRVA